MLEKITEKDRIILENVERDARVPLKKIARQARMSPEAVGYRLKKLEESGHILRYHAISNYFKLGLYKFKIYVRLKSPNPAIVRKICQYFYAHQKTEWVSHMGGRWDIIVGFLVTKPQEFADEIEAFMAQFSDFVLERAVTQTLYLAHQPRASIVGGENAHIVYHTTLDNPRAIDALDRKILQALANNARMGVNALSRLVKSTPRKIAYRIKQLEKDEVILAYKAHLDPKKFGRAFYKVIIYMKSMDRKKREEFIAFCGRLPNVVWPQQVLGSWDFEIDLDVPSEDGVYGVLSKIFEKFPDMVLNHEQCVQIEEYKLDLFPGALPPMRD